MLDGFSHTMLWNELWSFHWHDLWLHYFHFFAKVTDNGVLKKQVIFTMHHKKGQDQSKKLWWRIFRDDSKGTETCRKKIEVKWSERQISEDEQNNLVQIIVVVVKSNLAIKEIMKKHPLSYLAIPVAIDVVFSKKIFFLFKNFNPFSITFFRKDYINT